MKSKEQLKSFNKFCKEHPEHRFWQALRNWANVGFIFTSEDGKKIEDTFYKQ